MPCGSSSGGVFKNKGVKPLPERPWPVWMVLVFTGTAVSWACHPSLLTAVGSFTLNSEGGGCV